MQENETRRWEPGDHRGLLALARKAGSSPDSLLSVDEASVVDRLPADASSWSHEEFQTVEDLRPKLVVRRRALQGVVRLIELPSEAITAMVQAGEIRHTEWLGGPAIVVTFGEPADADAGDHRDLVKQFRETWPEHQVLSQDERSWVDRLPGADPLALSLEDLATLTAFRTRIATLGMLVGFLGLSDEQIVGLIIAGRVAYTPAMPELLISVEPSSTA